MEEEKYKRKEIMYQKCCFTVRFKKKVFETRFPVGLSMAGISDQAQFYSFVGVEHRISAAASPTKRSEQSPIFELENASNHYRSSSIFYCDCFRMEKIVETGKV